MQPFGQTVSVAVAVGCAVNRRIQHATRSTQHIMLCCYTNYIVPQELSHISYF